MLKLFVEVTTCCYESKQQHTCETGNGRDGTKQAEMPYFHYGPSSWNRKTELSELFSYQKHKGEQVKNIMKSRNGYIINKIKKIMSKGRGNGKEDKIKVKANAKLVRQENN